MVPEGWVEHLMSSSMRLLAPTTTKTLALTRSPAMKLFERPWVLRGEVCAASLAPASNSQKNEANHNDALDVLVPCPLI